MSIRARLVVLALIAVVPLMIDRARLIEANRTERVAGDIPVYLAYFTAWPDAQGSVRYYKDVYGRDAHLAQAIAKTREVRDVK